MTATTQTHYRMEPAPKLNPEGYLDGAWNVVSYVEVERGDGRSFFVRHRVVARFKCDGRDACERWAHKRNVRF